MLGDRVKIYTWTIFNMSLQDNWRLVAIAFLLARLFMCADRITIGNRVIISYNATIADSDFHPMDAAERKRDAVAISPFGNKSNRPLIITQPV